MDCPCLVAWDLDPVWFEIPIRPDPRPHCVLAGLHARVMSPAVDMWGDTVTITCVACSTMRLRYILQQFLIQLFQANPSPSPTPTPNPPYRSPNPGGEVGSGLTRYGKKGSEYHESECTRNTQWRTPTPRDALHATSNIAIHMEFTCHV